MVLMLKILKMKFPWNIWVMCLALVNLVGAMVYFNRVEAKLSLIAMFGSMLVMQIIYWKYGFVRLLGLGHIIFWVPFVIWNVLQFLLDSQLSGYFKVWLFVVSLLNTISLIIDFYDVYRFFRGDRDVLS